ncbi:hypothetical protein KR009_006731 [Drosophila setifemur]|nr:hypothetical protein KR009_006731 [Drosophila setifemur]
MNLIIAFLLFALVRQDAGQFLNMQCGLTLTPRIAHGHNATHNTTPWMVGIRNATKFQCGGTLIHNRTYFTKFSCCYIFIYFLIQVEIVVKQGIVHTGYDDFTYRNDIGLLRLSRPVVYSGRLLVNLLLVLFKYFINKNYNSTAKIFPICIPSNPAVKPIVDALSQFDILGWGLTENAMMSDTLQTKRLQRFDPRLCEEKLHIGLTSEQICAGHLVAGDACAGDSGGPMFWVANGRKMQVGIISVGHQFCGGIGIYTDVISYAGWIAAIVNPDL